MSDWEDRFEVDEFDREDGISREEIVHWLKEAHYAGKCDPHTCPICSGVTYADDDDL